MSENRGIPAGCDATAACLFRGSSNFGPQSHSLLKWACARGTQNSIEYRNKHFITACSIGFLVEMGITRFTDFTSLQSCNSIVACCDVRAKCTNIRCSHQHSLHTRLYTIVVGRVGCRCYTVIPIPIELTTWSLWRRKSDPSNRIRCIDGSVIPISSSWLEESKLPMSCVGYVATNYSRSWASKTVGRHPNWGRGK